jgi:hypothetical protein
MPSLSWMKLMYFPVLELDIFPSLSLIDVDETYGFELKEININELYKAAPESDYCWIGVTCHP